MEARSRRENSASAPWSRAKRREAQAASRDLEATMPSRLRQICHIFERYAISSADRDLDMPYLPTTQSACNTEISCRNHGVALPSPYLPLVFSSRGVGGWATRRADQTPPLWVLYVHFGGWSEGTLWVLYVL